MRVRGDRPTDDSTPAPFDEWVGHCAIKGGTGPPTPGPAPEVVTTVKHNQRKWRS